MKGKTNWCSCVKAVTGRLTWTVTVPNVPLISLVLKDMNTDAIDDVAMCRNLKTNVNKMLITSTAVKLKHEKSKRAGYLLKARYFCNTSEL